MWLLYTFEKFVERDFFCWHLLIVEVPPTLFLTSVKKEDQGFGKGRWEEGRIGDRRACNVSTGDFLCILLIS